MGFECIALVANAFLKIFYDFHIDRLDQPINKHYVKKSLNRY